MLDFFNEIQSWWQSTTPETRAVLQGAGVVVTALLAGHFLGSWVARVLRARNFDKALRLPGATPAGDADASFTPTFIGGMLVRLTVWTLAGWWLAVQHGRVELAETLELVISRTWAAAGVLVAILGLGSMLAHRLIDCLESVKSGPEASPLRGGTSQSTSSFRGAAGVVGAAAYVLVTLLALLIAADMFNWPLMRSSVQTLWKLAHQLLVAGAALLIGLLGARWARDLVAEPAASPEKRAGQYTALSLVAAATILALAVLLSSASVLIGLAALAVLGLLAWLVRGYLPDVFAGLQLRSHNVREAWFDGVPWQVTQIGFLATQVCRDGDVQSVPNRLVLQARMQAAPGEAAAR